MLVRDLTFPHTMHCAAMMVNCQRTPACASAVDRRSRAQSVETAPRGLGDTTRPRRPRPVSLASENAGLRECGRPS